MFIRLNTLTPTQLLAECAEKFGMYELRGSEISAGLKSFTLPYIKSPFWVTITAEIDGEYGEEIRVLVRPETQCSVGCPQRFLGDGRCQIACDNIACGFDSGDCCDLDREPKRRERGLQMMIGVDEDEDEDEDAN